MQSRARLPDGTGYEAVQTDKSLRGKQAFNQQRIIKRATEVTMGFTSSCSGRKAVTLLGVA
jgi:hypothetical protein